MELYRKLTASKKTKTALLLTVTILYFLGILAFVFHPGIGTVLWAAALIPSIMIFIYQKQIEREEKIAEAAKEAEADKEEAE